VRVNSHSDEDLHGVRPRDLDEGARRNSRRALGEGEQEKSCRPKGEGAQSLSR
jgi:hypothetical protein